MHPRRQLLISMALASLRASPVNAAVAGAPDVGNDDDGERVHSGRALRFPRDHGAHHRARIEWWYMTGWLGTQQAPTHGFQLTFFRTATGLAAQVNSRFAARHLLFAHAAVTVLGPQAGTGQHLHEQHIARWSGDPGTAGSRAQRDNADLVLGNWTLQRQGDRWLAQLPGRSFGLKVLAVSTQPLLLQGQAGFSRKGPEPEQASHYYSDVQLDASVQVTLATDKAATPAAPLQGRAWLDHEWSNELLHPQAVGWDWVGINLFDGSALTAFVLRRADGSTLWAGGSHRSAGGAVRSFEPGEVSWKPLRRWASPASGAVYPVQVALVCPAGRFEVRALLDAQELAGSQSMGAANIYWEGLSELIGPGGERQGLGYLEMTGYAARLRLG